ncbi:hypothetical protein ASG83_09820 [Yonghaparkia sp. Soil809]|nr:hypothetical protein ASG83_09820 [Yonghaparkia sp. Soil809]
MTAREPGMTEIDERDDDQVRGEERQEIQLVGDGDGVAVLGPPSAVEQFLRAEGLEAAEFPLGRLAGTAAMGGAALQAGGMVAEHSGRWVKMTKESYEVMKKYDLMRNSKTGLEVGVVYAKGQKGGIKHLVQFTRGAGASLTNPAVLAGLGGMLNQMALQQSIDEINRYLAVIDEKVDDILRAQKDAVLADMIGVDLVIDDAMTTRAHLGRVSEVTWSKVQATGMTIARTQAYAVRQISALAEKLERQKHVDDRAKLAREISGTVEQWLAVLAHCFRLADSLAVLELDRVLDAAPDDLEVHRQSLRAARGKRVELLTTTTRELLARLDAAAIDANERVLLNPISARTVVNTRNSAGGAIVTFQRALGLDDAGSDVEAKRWRQAVGDTRDKLVVGGEAGLDAAKELGATTARAARDFSGQARDRARSLTHRISSKIAERTSGTDDEDDAPPSS